MRSVGYLHMALHVSLVALTGVILLYAVRDCIVVGECVRID